MSTPGQTSPESSGGGRFFSAWSRHRGNFRRDNEDCIRVAPLEGEIPDPFPDRGELELDSSGPGSVAVVCDGVGGGAAGEVASALAIEAFVASLRQAVRGASLGTGDDLPARLGWMRDSVAAAHAAILAAVARDRSLEGMGTTLTGVWLLGTTLHLAQVGDSRLYRLRDRRLEQVSEDQSLVGRLRRDGTLSEDEARRHPLRNIVDQVVGGSEDGVEPVVSAMTVRRGEEYLLCSDGLTDAMPDRVLEDEMVAGLRRQPGVVVDHLVARVLEIAGRDNISIVLLRPFAARASLAATLFHRVSRPWRR